MLMYALTDLSALLFFECLKHTKAIYMYLNGINTRKSKISYNSYTDKHYVRYIMRYFKSN